MTLALIYINYKNRDLEFFHNIFNFTYYYIYFLRDFVLLMHLMFYRGILSFCLNNATFLSKT